MSATKYFLRLQLPAVHGAEDPVPCVALHVVGGLVEVPDPGDVVLPALAQHAPRVVDHHRRVPDRVSVVLVYIFCNNIDCLSLLQCCSVSS